MNYFVNKIITFTIICLFSLPGVSLAENQHIESSYDRSDQCIILLHGLARTKKSMKKMEKKLGLRVYTIINQQYPSRDKTIEELAMETIPKAIDRCQESNIKKIHFVTHSMGGILLRYYLTKKEIPLLGRVVMLSPPNQGSEAVDKLANMPGFKLINGKAGQQLGTQGEGLPRRLGPVNFELGVITGNKSINLILSKMIPGKDDGKVSLESAKVEGMKDFLVVEHSHPFIMKSDYVINQTIYFLEEGRFKKK